MSLPLTPADQKAVELALREVRERADGCVLSGSLEDIRASLSDVWSAVRKAHQAIHDAEENTRRQALARLETIA